MTNSPLATAGPDQVALADGKLGEPAGRFAFGVDRRCDVVGAFDRIEQEKTTTFPNDGTSAATHIRRCSPR